ncbi:armadillo-type protein [Pelagophyceae sp. CCMP2097]|nr:armadillo-type protein [Pelagophyceae sp. CCMP2097]
MLDRPSDDEGATADESEDVDCAALDAAARLIDQLKAEDASARAAAHAGLPRIARALGPQRVRDELVPFLADSTDDADEVLIVIAEQLGALTKYVGGPQHAHVLLEPIEVLAAVEDSAVRERAVEAALEVAACMDGPALAAHFVPFVRRLGGHEWFTARISACGLCAAPAAGDRAALRAVFSQLCRDDTPMVRRVAAAKLGAVAAGGAAGVDSDLANLFRALAEDDQDSVRLQTAANCVALGALGSAALRSTVVLPVALAAAGDRSWRVRWSVANQFDALCRALVSPPGAAPATRDALLAAFCELLQDGEAKVRAAAARALAAVARELGAAGVADLLVPRAEALAGDASPQVRAALAGVAGDLAPLLAGAGGPEGAQGRAVAVLLALLRDASTQVRLNVIARLAPVHAAVGMGALAEALLPAIVELAGDAKWRVRAAVVDHMPAVARQLGRAVFDESLAALCVAWLDDAVDAVRAAATRNLRLIAAEFGADWAATNALLRVAALRSHPSYLRRSAALRAATALAEVVDAPDVAGVVDWAVDACGDGVPNCRFCACDALRALAATVSERHADAVGPAAQGALADEWRRVAPTLRRLAAEDADTDVRDAAERALAAVDAPRP